jgi:hypothetical protein
MTDKAQSAELIMKLYELRREEVMRQARQWFFSFQPETIEDIMRTARGEHSAFYRMVTSYWDMACSFVNHGAIDEQMFNDANQEHVLVFSKIQPFLEGLRAATSPNYARQLEEVVMRLPEAEQRLARFREMVKQMTAERAAAANEQAEAEAANA